MWLKLHGYCRVPAAWSSCKLGQVHTVNSQAAKENQTPNRSMQWVGLAQRQAGQEHQAMSIADVSLAEVSPSQVCAF